MNKRELAEKILKKDNKISMKLQRSLGMDISKEKVYWVFK